MKLVLIRHAAAVPKGTPGVLDAERPLTSSGKVKFRRAARGLSRVMPRPHVLLTSPLSRAHETADIAAEAFRDIAPGIEPSLADPGIDGILAALETQPRDATIALVGHEPMLGLLLARLLGGSVAEHFAFKKGGAAVVDLPDGPSTSGRLIWFLNPRVLRTLATGPGNTGALRKESSS